MLYNICRRCNGLILIVSLGIFSQAFWCHCFSQPINNRILWDRIISVEKEDSITFEKRLVKILSLKEQFERNRLNKDSVYARLLHRIAFYEFKISVFSV